jgi:hypothetical protein
LVVAVEVSSGSSAPHNVILDDERIMRLAFKTLKFTERELHHRSSKSPWPRGDVAIEYWALRFAVLFLEKRGIVNFDNVADGDAHYKEIIDKLRSFAE